MVQTRLPDGQGTLNICSKDIAAKEGAAHRNINKQGFNITVLCTSIQSWFFTTNVSRPCRFSFKVNANAYGRDYFYSAVRKPLSAVLCTKEGEART